MIYGALGIIFGTLGILIVSTHELVALPVEIIFIVLGFLCTILSEVHHEELSIFLVSFITNCIAALVAWFGSMFLTSILVAGTPSAANPISNSTTVDIPSLEIEKNITSTNENITPSINKETLLKLNAPNFEQFGVFEKYEEKSNSINFEHNEFAQRFKTHLLDASEQQANFAGHYIVTTWGCGTQCRVISLIDKKTGNVFNDRQLSNVINSSAGDANYPSDVINQLHSFSLDFNIDSNLMIVWGCVGDECSSSTEGVSYFLWEHDKFRKIFHVPLNGKRITYRPEKNA